MEFVTFEMKVPVQSVVIGQPCQQGGPERVAGADRVDDLHDGSRNFDFAVSVHANGALCSEGHDDEPRPTRQQRTGGFTKGKGGK